MTEGPRDDAREPADDGPAAAQQPDAETTWLSPGAPPSGGAAPSAADGDVPGSTTTADTAVLGGTPTTVDPLVPAWTAPTAPVPPPPPAPPASAPLSGPAAGWSSAGYPPPVAPPPPPPAGWATAAATYPPTPSTPPPPAHGAPAYGAPAYGAPAYGAPAYGPPAYGPPAYSPGVSGWGAVPRAPKPGIVALRPLGVGDILDGAISYIRRDPATVLGIATVLSVILALTQLWAITVTGDSLAISSGDASLDESLGSVLGSTTATLVQSVLSLVVGVVATGLLTVVIGQAVLGRRVSIQEAWARGSRRLLPLLGLTLLVSLTTGLVGGAGVLLAVGIGVLVGQSLDPGVGVLVGLPIGLAGIAAAVWIYVRLLLAPVALVLESTGVTRSIVRSWDLVRGSWWRTFGIYLLATILASVVASVLAVPFALAGTFLSLDSLASGSLPLTYTVPLALGTLVTGVVTLPFSAGVVALLYVDRRIRREALDLELARAAGVSTGA